MTATIHHLADFHTFACAHCRERHLVDFRFVGVEGDELCEECVFVDAEEQHARDESLASEQRQPLWVEENWS